MAGYAKWSRHVFQTFRFQLLHSPEGAWMRVRWINTGEYFEADVHNLDMSRLKKDLAATNAWNVFDAKKYAPYFKKLLEDAELATKVVTLHIRPQRLFKHEERDDMLFSALITMQSREPSDIWLAYQERNNER